MLPDFVSGLSGLLTALTDVVGAIEKNVASYHRLGDAARTRRDVAHWTRILFAMQQQQQRQVSIPGSLRLFAKNGDMSRAKAFLTIALEDIDHSAAQIRKGLEDHGDKLMIRDNRLYTELLAAQRARSRFAEFIKTDPELTPADLVRVADLYDGLIDQMARFQEAFAIFVALAEKGRAG